MRYQYVELVTTDKYELPCCVCESWQELSELTNISVNILYQICRRGTYIKYGDTNVKIVRVEKEQTEKGAIG